MSQVVGGTPLGAAAPVDIVPPLVLLVVEGSKGQNVEEEQGGSHSDGHRQLGGVVTLVHQVWLVEAVLGIRGEWSRIRPLGHQNLGLWGAVCSIWWRNLMRTRTSFINMLFTVSIQVCNVSSFISLDTKSGLKLNSEAFLSKCF